MQVTPQILLKAGVLSRSFVNGRGNLVQAGHWHADRYAFDFSRYRKGWRQFDTDQDAWYYGFWTNRARLQTFSYCEGDVTLVTCPTPAHYNAEIMDACRFHAPSPAFIGIDPDTGTVTHYFEDRSEHFVKLLAPLSVTTPLCVECDRPISEDNWDMVCYECQCYLHRIGAFDMDGKGWM